MAYRLNGSAARLSFCFALLLSAVIALAQDSQLRWHYRCSEGPLGRGNPRSHGTGLQHRNRGYGTPSDHKCGRSVHCEITAAGDPIA